MHAFYSRSQSTPEDVDGLVSRAVFMAELQRYRVQMDMAAALAAEVDGRYYTTRSRAQDPGEVAELMAEIEAELLDEGVVYGPSKLATDRHRASAAGGGTDG